MTTIEQLEHLNKIEEKEFEGVFQILLNSFLINKNSKSNSFIEKKEYIINNFSEFLNKYIELNFVTSKKKKLELINFIDKLNMQLELLELSKNKTNISDIKIAAQRLGKKAQSAFESK